MSWTPCSNCRQTRPGRLRFVYLATFEGERRISHRLRLCADCYEGFIPELQRIAEEQDQLGRWLAPEARV
jgi:hypothetical protein